MNNDHLTVEQMEALLSHPEAQDRSQHLQVCGTCEEEFESLRAVVSDLRGAVIAASEVHRQRAVMPAAAHRTPRAMWSLVAAVALLCVAGPIALHQRLAHFPVAQVSAPQVQAAVSDEQLMSDVQEDLSSSVPQVMLPLTAKDASDGAAGSTSNLKENE
jgi:hypothetical protein